MMEKTKNHAVWSAAVIGLKLLLICAIIAGIVSFVYALTHDTYLKNQEGQKAEAIGKIFSLDAPVTKEIAENVYAVYDTDGKTLKGYCVEVVESSGYNGDITMMVGYDIDKCVSGVEIVSHSETPGLGSKVESDGYRSQFIGTDKELTYEEIDGISGATFSSKAVLAGVNKATAALTAALKTNGGAN